MQLAEECVVKFRANFLRRIIEAALRGNPCLLPDRLGAQFTQNAWALRPDP